MKLHLGCGKRAIPGWTHVDVAPFDHINICHAVDTLPMIPDNSVEVIYACHVLEHFMRRNLWSVLTEWKRILEPGGLLRVAVPDLEALIELYQEKKDLELIIGPMFGRQDYLYNFHYMVYDEKTLFRHLELAGFKDVHRYDWRETEHADVDDYSQSYYPHMAKETGKLLSLNVEAIKPC